MSYPDTYEDAQTERAKDEQAAELFRFQEDRRAALIAAASVFSQMTYIEVDADVVNLANKFYHYLSTH